MMEDELIKIWQTSPKHEQIKFEKSKLMLEVQTSLNKFDAAIKRRDLLEIGTAIILVPIFAYQGYRLDPIVAKIGALVIVFYCLFVVYKLLKAKKQKPDTFESYLDYLQKTKTYLEVQKLLLDTVVYWYILPALLGSLLIMIGVLDLTSKSLRAIINIARLWLSLGVFAAIGIFTYWLNKRAVKNELVPRIQKIEVLLELLKED